MSRSISSRLPDGIGRSFGPSSHMPVSPRLSPRVSPARCRSTKRPSLPDETGRLAAEEFLQTLLQPRSILCPALPNDEYVPAEFP